MTIIRKADVQKYINELNQFHDHVLELLTQAPNEDNWAAYCLSPTDFERDFSNVDLDELERFLTHYRNTVKFTVQLKKRAAKTLG